MDLKKAILSAASILALTSAAGKSAEAAIPANSSAKSATKVSTEADGLFNLITRTQGSLSGNSIENALIEMFANASPEEIERVPALFANIVTLGATPEVVTRLRDVLIGLVSSTSGIEQGLRDSVIAQLELGVTSIVLAQKKTFCSTDPASSYYDPNCAPPPVGPAGTPGSLQGGGGPGS